MLKTGFCVILFNIVFLIVNAQYVVNGNAFSTSCNCYTITQPVNNQSGSVWNSNQINLAQSFDFKFDIFLGCADANGADGMAFILQPISTIVGTSGGGMGFQGITPSVGILLDTYQNGNNNDPAYDHISINTNGNINHNVANNLAGPIQIINGNDNAEDCNWHVLRVVWNATTQQLTAFIDGVQRVEANIDLVNTIFSGNPNVFWGFTAATGGLNNEQKFCTRLNAQIENLSGIDTFCHPATVNLNPVIDAFGPVDQYYWNMGDGTIYTTPTVSHNYTTHGLYTIKFAIKGIDGCVSDTATKQIVMGGAPSVALFANDACSGDSIRTQFAITTNNFNGTIAEYIWLVDNVVASVANGGTIFNNYSVGGHQAAFFVKTNYGCSSNVALDSFYVYPKPAIPSIIVTNTCEGQNTVISSSNNTAGIINGWLIDGVPYSNNNPISAVFTVGLHTIKHYLINNNNCTSDTATATFTVFSKPTAHFNVTNECVGTNITLSPLNALAGHSYEWFIDGALVSNNQFFSTGNLTVGNHIIKLIQRNGGICVDSMSKTITIADKPSISSSAPTVCLGQSTPFTATLNNPPMNIVNWQWIFPDGTTAATQNVNKTFLTEGNYTAKLIATNDMGCKSDTLPLLFTIVKPFAFAGNDTLVVQNQTFNLNGSGSGNIFQWQPLNLVSNAAIPKPSVLLNADQLFVLTVTDASGCTAIDSVYIKVFKGSNIFMPNAFTPNNDGKNDVLKPFYIGIKTLSYFNVFNRWGQQIYSTSSLNGFWDGTFNGKQQPTGTYVWTIKAVDFFSKEYILKGVVTIIR